MAKLIYIPAVDPLTFLYFSDNARVVKLRDYSRGPYQPPVEQEMKREAADRILVAGPITELKVKSSVNKDNWAFWHERIVEANQSLTPPLPGNQGIAMYRRLLDRFNAEVGYHLGCGDASGLAECIGRWSASLRIVTKKRGFNHWDEDDASSRIGDSDGMGWTSAMLEHCRRDGKLSYIDAGNAQFDFALTAMDLNLGISSSNNPALPDQRDCIKPDGLGVRRDGSLCVIEAKAINDCNELVRAIIQAFCGAVAVHSVRDWITRTASRALGRRPAITLQIPDGHRSYGLYMMVDAHNYHRRCDAKFHAIANLLLSAWPILRDIVFFAVDPRMAGFPVRMPFDVSFRLDDQVLMMTQS